MFREASWGVRRRTGRDGSEVLGGVALVLACVLGALAWKASQAPTASITPVDAPPTAADPPAANKKAIGSPGIRVPLSVLIVALTWLAALIASFICYERIDGFADFVSFKLGRLPFETIWFGAAGGWLISAQGIFDHNRKWLRSYDYWHYVRPILGALIGTLGCLVFIVLNDAATEKHVATNAVFYDVAALAIGYREASFRKLIAKLLDTIILPGETPKESTEPSPAQGDKPSVEPAEKPPAQAADAPQT